MSDILPNTPGSASLAADHSPSATPLMALRAELDRIDDSIHDLLMQRAEVVDRVGQSGGKGRVALRAGREASILRRLLARHAGPLPRRAIARIWRELLAATTAMQGNYVIAVCERAPAGTHGGGFVSLAREHFGALTPMRVLPSAAQAIAEVSGGAAAVAVLPVPEQDEPNAAAWWTALTHRDDPRIYVVARLPFWAARVEGSPQGKAFVVAAVPPDPSGRDRALIGLELPVEMSRARLVAAVTKAGFAHTQMLVWRDPAAPVAQVLLEVEGLVADDDPRLGAVRAALGGLAPVVLGGYAVPIEGEGP